MKQNPTPIAAFAASVFALAVSGCVTASQHRDAIQDTQRLTVGTVQKDVHVGMSGADVVAILGAPNIVTTDEQRREVWTYDRISTDSVYSFGGASLNPLIFATGSVQGLVSGGISQSAGASSRTQRTLTVVIKYDEQKRVRDFAYHSTTF